MKTFRLAAVLIFAAMPNLTIAADNTTQVALADTPVAVQKLIASQIGDRKVDAIQRSQENGETTFEVDYTTKAGADADFTVADDGTLLKIGVSPDDAPAAVRKTVQSRLPGWDVTGVNKNVADTEVSYDVSVSKNGHDRTLNIAENGTLNCMDMALEETPAAIQTAIKAQIANGKVQSIEEDFDPDGNSFDIETITETGAGKSFSLSQDGRLLSVGITLDEVPPAARNTIMRKIGNGKILEIDKSLVEKKDNVLPYQVQGRKDGKPFNFSVGPRGRFLGMDED